MRIRATTNSSIIWSSQRWVCGIAILIVSMFGHAVSAQQNATRVELFNLKDLNQDEKLDTEEFSGGAIGRMRENQDEVFHRKDLDQDGFLNFEEFSAGAKWTSEEREERAQESREVQQTVKAEWFESRDKNEDGWLSVDEYCFEMVDRDLLIAKGKFAVLDRDENAELELEEMLNEQGLWSDPRVTFPRVDLDLNGILDLEEYLEGIKDKNSHYRSRAYFFRSDLDGSHGLNMKEYTNLAVIRGRSEKFRRVPKSEFHLAYFDLNENKEVEFDEFESMLRKEGALPAYIQLLQETLDKNKNGFLTPDEIRRMSVAPWMDRKFDFLFKDANADGELTVKELIGPHIGYTSEFKTRSFFLDRDFDLDNRLSFDEFRTNNDDKRIEFMQLDGKREGILKLDEMLERAVDDSERETILTMFRSHDLNRNRQLSLEEYTKNPRSQDVRFAFLDVNSNGRVSWLEYVPEADRKSPRNSRHLEFQARDLDQNGYLSPEEVALKYNDPRLVFGRKDIDGDRHLSSVEFASIANVVQGSTESQKAFRGKDIDRDGLVDFDEYQLSDEDPRVVFSIEDLNGDGFVELSELTDEKAALTRIKTPHTFIKSRDINRDGKVSPDEHRLGWKAPAVQFNVLDSDANDKLTEEEFVKDQLGKPNEDRRRLAFSKKDKDVDGALTFQEYSFVSDDDIFEKRIRSLPKEEQGFARLDRSMDGQLELKEFVSNFSAESSNENQRERIFHALDVDLDSIVTLNEYLATPESNAQLHFATWDLDGDRGLSLEEFGEGAKSHEADPARVFAKYDIDQSSTLTVDEFIRLIDGRAGRERWSRLVTLLSRPTTWIMLIVALGCVWLVYVMGRSVIRKLASKERTGSRVAKA